MEDEIDAMVEQVLALEREAEFFEAMKLAREAQAKATDPRQSQELQKIVARLRKSRRAAAELRQAVTNLSADRQSAIDVARRALLDAGEIGKVFLLKAVEEAEPAAAAEAADISAELHDPQGALAMAGRYERTDDPDLRRRLIDALSTTADAVPPGLASRMYRWLELPDSQFNQRHIVALLGQVYDRAFEHDRSRFAPVIGGEEKLSALEQYVQRAIASGDPALITWAATKALPLGPLIPGFHGRYFAGNHLDTLVYEQVDEHIEFDHREDFPDRFHDMGQFSGRWTGLLMIEEAGSYEFSLHSDDGHRLVIDDETLIDRWNKGPSRVAVTTILEPGAHELRIDWQEDGGAASVTARWRRSEDAWELLGAPEVKTPPWSGITVER